MTVDPGSAPTIESTQDETAESPLRSVPSDTKGGRVFRLPESWNRAFTLLAVIGGLVAVLGVIVAPERTAPSVLLGVFFLLGLALGGLLFVAFQNLTSATWTVALRRVFESMALTMPIAAGLSIAVLALIPQLYEWSHADVMAHDALIEAKTPWLNPFFFIVRTVVCVGSWVAFTYYLITVQRRREAAGGSGCHDRPLGVSGVFVLVFALTFSVICFDWIMSLEPHWFSTVFAVYNFSGLFLGGVAVVTVFAILLSRLGPLAGVVRPDHLHDLGKLMLSFSTFWAYIWFCQYMLIWYANIPEETAYFIAREKGSWAVVFYVNLLVNWLIPFFVLLPRGAKRNETAMLSIAILLIVGRWLDLYLMVSPPFQESGPALGAWEVFPVIGALSLFAILFFRQLGKTPIVSTSDPRLKESLDHHQ